MTDVLLWGQSFTFLKGWCCDCLRETICCDVQLKAKRKSSIVGDHHGYLYKSQINKGNKAMSLESNSLKFRVHRSLDYLSLVSGIETFGIKVKLHLLARAYARWVFVTQSKRLCCNKEDRISNIKRWAVFLNTDLKKDKIVYCATHFFLYVLYKVIYAFWQI